MSIIGNSVMIGGGSGSIKLSSIAITTPPSKTNYYVGDAFDATGMVVTATYSNGATLAVGGYTVSPAVLALNNSSVTISYTEAGVTQTATQAITVTKQSVTIPTFTQTLTYNTSTQTPSFTNDPGALAVKSGDTSGTNAGNYTITFTLNDTDLYQWSDGSITPKDVDWNIGKKEATISVSPSSVTLDTSNLTATATITTDGDGTLQTPTSSDSNVATATLSGSVVTISHVNQTNGTATITVTQNSGTNYLSANCTISVTASFVPNDVNDATWAQISEISQAGTGDTYWDVGDTKAITLNGTVGTKAYSNVTLYVYILDFNHPTNKTTADNNIIWGGFKDANGVDVCLDDSGYGSNYSDGTKYFNMNHWGSSSSPYNTNYGGWKGCDLRYDILGSVNTAPSGYGSTPTTSRVGYDSTETAKTTPVSNTLMAALPSDFRNVLRLHTHYVDNKGNSSNVDANVTSCVDLIFLLAEFEIFGARSDANTYEQNHQKQMTYYVNGNSKVKYKQSGPTTAAYWWESSPHYNTAHPFCSVTATGTATYPTSRSSRGLAPAFKT